MADDGKRFCGERCIVEMGGGPGGGVLKIRPDGRDSDFPLYLKIAVLLACQLILAPFSGK